MPIYLLTLEVSVDYEGSYTRTLAYFSNKETAEQAKKVCSEAIANCKRAQPYTLTFQGQKFSFRGDRVLCHLEEVSKGKRTFNTVSLSEDD